MIICVVLSVVFTLVKGWSDITPNWWVPKLNGKDELVPRGATDFIRTNSTLVAGVVGGNNVESQPLVFELRVSSMTVNTVSRLQLPHDKFPNSAAVCVGAVGSNLVAWGQTDCSSTDSRPAITDKPGPMLVTDNRAFRKVHGASTWEDIGSPFPKTTPVTSRMACTLEPGGGCLWFEASHDGTVQLGAYVPYKETTHQPGWVTVTVPNNFLNTQNCTQFVTLQRLQREVILWCYLYGSNLNRNLILVWSPPAFTNTTGNAHKEDTGNVTVVELDRLCNIFTVGKISFWRKLDLDWLMLCDNKVLGFDSYWNNKQVLYDQLDIVKQKGSGQLCCTQESAVEETCYIYGGYTSKIFTDWYRNISMFWNSITLLQATSLGVWANISDSADIRVAAEQYSSYKHSSIVCLQGSGAVYTAGTTYSGPFPPYWRFINAKPNVATKYLPTAVSAPAMVSQSYKNWRILDQYGAHLIYNPYTTTWRTLSSHSAPNWPAWGFVSPSLTSHKSAWSRWWFPDGSFRDTVGNMFNFYCTPPPQQHHPSFRAPIAQSCDETQTIGTIYPIHRGTKSDSWTDTFTLYTLPFHSNTCNWTATNYTVPGFRFGGDEMNGAGTAGWAVGGDEFLAFATTKGGQVVIFNIQSKTMTMVNITEAGSLTRKDAPIKNLAIGAEGLSVVITHGDYLWVIDKSGNTINSVNHIGTLPVFSKAWWDPHMGKYLVTAHENPVLSELQAYVLICDDLNADCSPAVIPLPPFNTTSFQPTIDAWIHPETYHVLVVQSSLKYSYPVSNFGASVIYFASEMEYANIRGFRVACSFNNLECTSKPWLIPLIILMSLLVLAAIAVGHVYQRKLRLKNRNGLSPKTPLLRKGGATMPVGEPTPTTATHAVTSIDVL